MVAVPAFEPSTRFSTPARELLRASARRFAAERFSIDDLRRERDHGDGPEHSRLLWAQMAALGLANITIEECRGGAGQGYAELGIVMEALGSRLATTPMLSTAVLGATAFQELGSERQRRELLPRIAAGEMLTAFALQERSRFDPYRIETTAVPRERGYRLDGRKLVVLDATLCDLLVVVARTSGAVADRDGLSLFLVDRSAPGVTMTDDILLDSRRSSAVTFDGVVVALDRLVGPLGGAAAGLDHLIAVANVCLSAEMLGGIVAAFETTLEYLRQREQFGVKIGSFQALQHRAVDWFCEVELTRSIVEHALLAIDARDPELAQIACICKARAADTYLLSGGEGIQMHGGIGMTDEHDAGFYLKRAAVTEQLFGDSAWQRRRYAELRGY
jgi:acyl-CoA dehydrogenase